MGSSSVGSKVLTCCYCGVHATFVPGGKGVAALVCSTCGAPLNAQKIRPLAPGKGAKLPTDRSDTSIPATKAKSYKSPKPGYMSSPKPLKKKKTKKKKGLFYKVVSEAIDVIEDIFD